MGEQPVLCFRRNAATAAEVERILGLPNGLWTGIEVRLATQEPATCKVELFLTADQLTALARLAVTPPEHIHDFVHDDVCWCGASEQGGEH